jgi:ribosomal protein L16 Arg81 hydroxylase
MNHALRQLLGGHTPERFLRKYWQKDPLLVEAALPGFSALLTRDELFALAARDDVQSRLVQRTGRRYTQHDGPFKRTQLERLPARNWTLLVQGVNLQDGAADALLRRFASSRASRRSTKRRWHLATCCTCRPVMRTTASRSTNA